MKLNRTDFLRVLKIVKSSGMGEVRFDEEGNFGLEYEGGDGFLFGKGVKFGQKLAFAEVDMPIKMLSSFSQMEINADVVDSRLILTAGELKFGQRLANWDLIAGIEGDSIKKQLEEPWKWCNGKLKYEELSKVKKLIDTLGVDEISLKEQDGVLLIRVGSDKTSFGEVSLTGIGLVGEIKFEAAKIANIISVVDTGEISVSIGFQERVDEKLNEKYFDGNLKIVSGEFTWYLGSLKSGESQKDQAQTEETGKKKKAPKEKAEEPEEQPVA